MATQRKQANDYLRIAKQLLQEDNVNQALLVLHEAEKTIKDNAGILYYIGISYHKSKQFANAKNYYSQSLAIKDNVFTLFGLAQIKWQEEGAQVALPFFRQIIEQKKANLTMLIESARAALEASFFNEARAWLNLALKQDPQNDFIFFLFAASYSMEEEYQQSLSFYKQALIYNKTNALYWHNYAFSCVQLKQYNEALQAYNEAIKIQPSIASLSDIAELYIKLANPEKAFSIWHHCFIKEKNNIETWQTVLNYSEEYTQEVHRLLVLAPNEVLQLSKTKLALALFYEQKGQIDSAIQIRQQIVKTKPNLQKNTIQLICLLWQNQEQESALALLDQAILPLYQKSFLCLRLAQSCQIQKDQLTSANLLEKSIDYNKQNHTSWLLLGLHSWNAKEYQSAALCFIKAKEKALTIPFEIKQLFIILVQQQTNEFITRQFFQACIIPFYFLDNTIWTACITKELSQFTNLLYFWLAHASQVQRSFYYAPLVSRYKRKSKQSLYCTSPCFSYKKKRQLKKINLYH